MDSAKNNSFYAFDDHSKYIRFHMFPRHKLYQFDLKPSLSDGIVLYTIKLKIRRNNFWY